METVVTPPRPDLGLLGLADAPEPCRSCTARAFSFCGALRAAELAELAAVSTQVTLAAGQPLIAPDAPARDVFNVTTGVLRAGLAMPDERRQVTGFLLPGDFVGFGAGETYGFGVEAVTAATLCRFDRPRFTALLHAHPGMERRLLCMASDEVREARAHQLLLGRKTASERLASFLRDLAARQARRGGAPDVAALGMSRADIADHLGLTPESVSRGLTALKVAGLIRLEPAGRVRLLRPPALAALAEGRPEA